MKAAAQGLGQGQPKEAKKARSALAERRPGRHPDAPFAPYVARPVDDTAQSKKAAKRRMQRQEWRGRSRQHTAAGGSNTPQQQSDQAATTGWPSAQATGRVPWMRRCHRRARAPAELCQPPRVRRRQPAPVGVPHHAPAPPRLEGRLLGPLLRVLRVHGRERVPEGVQKTQPVAVEGRWLLPLQGAGGALQERPAPGRGRVAWPFQVPDQGDRGRAVAGDRGRVVAWSKSRGRSRSRQNAHAQKVSKWRGECCPKRIHFLIILLCKNLPQISSS